MSSPAPGVRAVDSAPAAPATPPTGTPPAAPDSTATPPVEPPPPAGPKTEFENGGVVKPFKDFNWLLGVTCFLTGIACFSVISTMRHQKKNNITKVADLQAKVEAQQKVIDEIQSERQKKNQEIIWD